MEIIVIKILIFLIVSYLIISIVTSIVSKSNQRKKDRELLESVTSLNRGTRSERELIIGLLKNGIPRETIFHDLIIKKNNNKFSQIDLVIPTKEGIIVFEVKEYSGWIFGSGQNTNWTQILAYGERKYKFYNPIKQNNAHIIELKKTLKQFQRVPFFSIIVFFGDCELKEINYVPNGTYIVKAQRLFEVLDLIKSENEPTSYTNKREVVETLKKLVSFGENVEYQNQHIENIKDMTGEERIFK